VNTPTPGTGDIEQRLLRVEARQQLTELVSRYCVGTDDRDYDALARLFTEDARFNAIQGRAAVLAYFRQQQAKMGP
jgi:SnoaL-like protein